MSCSSKPTFFFFFFFFFFSLAFFRAAYAEDPRYYLCFNNQTYTPDNSYEGRLKKLLYNLNVQAPSYSGFKALIEGDSVKVYGLALCRGDRRERECYACLRDARRDILDYCPYKKGAIIWYDHCHLKYSDTNFFGEIDRENRFCMYGENAEYPERLNPKIHELLDGLASRVSGTPKLYASGAVELEWKSGKVYGMVQCTRDLSGDDCKKCADEVVGEFPLCSPGARCGRVVRGSCNFRYELKHFIREQLKS